MVQAVIFDLNGVFLESEYLNARISKEYEIDGQKFLQALQEVMDIVRKPSAKKAFDVWKPRLAELGLDIDEDEFFDFWFSGEKLIQDLVDYCYQLRKQGLQIFILSNNFRERTQYYQVHFPQIFEAVDKAYFSWETGYIKPDPRAFQNILEENRLEPEECMYFDDSTTNVQSAQELRIRAYVYEGLEKTRELINTAFSQ